MRVVRESISYVHQIECLFQAADGTCERCQLIVVAGDDGFTEPHVGPLTGAGKTTLAGWGDMDGEAVVLDRNGCGSYLIPSTTWAAISTA